MSNTAVPAESVAGRYRLIRRVGGGNMSTVYEAQDTRRGNRTVAVKLLNTEHDDALKQEIFRRETRALSQLEHPNIVSVLDYGWSDEHRCHYLVFAYIPRTLLEEISAHRDDRDHDWCWPLMLCWLPGTSVHKIGESRQYNRSHLPSCLHEKAHRSENSRIGKPILNEHTYTYLINQIEK